MTKQKIREKKKEILRDPKLSWDEKMHYIKNLNKLMEYDIPSQRIAL